MKLTIAFDDISLPLPPMKPPDIRQRVIEAVLDMAADAGVDDVAADRRQRAAPADDRGRAAAHAVGERVFDAFYPQGRLYNHDAEDPDEIAHLGTTDKGEDVEISKRAAESDLLVYVNINLVAMDGGHKSVGIGLASYRSLRHHHNADTMRHSRSFMDHKQSELHSSHWRMGRVIARRGVKVFQIETTLNNDMFPTPFDFLQKREWEWSAADQATMLARRSRARAARRAQAGPQDLPRLEAPLRADRRPRRRGRGGARRRRCENVHAPAARRGRGAVRRARRWGCPTSAPTTSTRSMNPILVDVHGARLLLQPLPRPAARAQGRRGDPQPPDAEGVPPAAPPVLRRLLRGGARRDDRPDEIEAKYEKQFAEDAWYSHLYRTSHAYHGVHPFYMWYWCAHALDHVGDVIVGRRRPTAVRRLGFRAASTLDDALEMASDVVGRQPSITYLHNPPMFLSDVT